MKWLSKYLNGSLKKLLIFYIVIGILVPLIITISIFFIRTRKTMITQTISNVNEKVNIIAQNIDDLIGNVHSVSDQYAYDDEIEAYISKSYENYVVEKRRDIHDMQIIFAKGDFLKKNVRLAAVINKHSELMNFLDPIYDNKDILNKLYDMGVDDKKNLSKMIWQPIQDNFLQERKTGFLRNDKVVIGSRRIIDFRSGRTNAIHIFALNEEEIWDRYAALAKDVYGEFYYSYPQETRTQYAFVEREKGGIYIINDEGEIISSTEELALQKGKMDEELFKKIKGHSENQFELIDSNMKQLICRAELWNTDWQVIAMIPIHKVTEDVDKLFISILIVSVICILLCLVVIHYIAKHFLEPIDTLNQSMEAVYNGNMQAYVEMKGYGEIQQMGAYYNSMLHKINVFISEKVETEKKKKQLEMEVLMCQINPHFLYNTLETIVWKSSEVGRPDIGRIAASLGRLYRLSISNGETIVKIQQEIEHLMMYINIQKVRYKERMDFDLIVDYEAIRGYRTIKLILQPAVENCFMYAMEHIHHPLQVKLQVNVLEEEIHFTISDNGSGMNQEALKGVRDQIQYGKKENKVGLNHKGCKGTGIGLHSISERIKLYFGKKDAVTINSEENVGTIVSIVIPKIEY